ncbi:hypothetical protein CC80DRAFT_590468 [Byssothecium circinans]|uniref:Shugoshin n=1 Tax=Byssothecium circinans TaxID=147558 RepID=A0A6A5U4T7_9PLEO|nr:hypothetical protein CC80DRAFT_590468 [Byssothecium circinans]
MARLNEPPIAPAPSAETIDAVKRRFLRQNRELAKINSQQSIRIRTLENDASRLLSENLSLREQVLHLQNALGSQSNSPSLENIDSVKEQLEAKLQEFGALVAGLGEWKKKDAGLPRCKSQLAATRRSPGERQWRSGLCLQEVENAMLPTIAEDKFYPRRTMNADELQNILDDPDSQSPDIGPPPVSRFETQDPIAFNPSPTPEEPVAEPTEDQEPALPSNLETRRKRRESGPKLNIRRVSMFESSPEGVEENATKPVRAGAKRKFSVQEDEEKARPPTETFRYSRRNAPGSLENPTLNEQPRTQSPERIVLGTKPVNTDPVLSPKKQRSSVANKPEKLEKKSLPKTGRSRLTITREAKHELPTLEMPPPVSVAEINVDSLPPKTPAADLIFSPPNTEPSTSRPESKDTPPPGDLSVGNQVGMSARPSRRVRPQVSYKEPSLNTKMRRPGKELIDAVISDQHHRTSMDSQAAPSTVGRTSIKQEPDDSAWKPKGAGSVVERMGEDGAEVGSPLRQKMDRKEGGQDTKPEAIKLNSAAAANAISALINETSTAKRRTQISAPVQPWKTATEPQKQLMPEQPAKRQDDLAIFDFNESSPATTDDAASASTYARPRNELAKAARQARRHSSVPASADIEERKVESSVKAEKTDGALPSVQKRTNSGTVRSTTSVAKNPVSARALGRERETREKERLSSKVEGEGRAERAASRRKSMMI